ncbi:GAF domain-containing protein [Rhizobium sp. FY34]|uniref:GAF domain-containing protein n=1 Tax=Rhizobium sp. FY34 TaxID=2562309 RepID=UPI0010C02CEC|nr:GAF domain-containing protein [Rhizobium sp. FY34]
MRQDANHSDVVYATAARSAAVIASPVAASWRRCLDLHRLAPEQDSNPLRVDDQVFREAFERMEPVIRTCADEIDRLYELVGRSGCCIILSDRQGIVVDRRSATGDDEDFRRLGLWRQHIWSEASAGTNGIGTALADERAVIIHRDQHFLSANTGLSCATAPIRDHLGRVSGALDVSTCRHSVDETTLSIVSQAVREAALRVEVTLFRQAYRTARHVMVPGASMMSALLAVDQDDIVVGATRAARLALKLDDLRIAQGLVASDVLREDRGDKGSDLQDAERAGLRRALSRASGNVSKAAQILGISRATMHRKLKQFDLQ